MNDLNLVMFIMNISIILLCGVLMAILPYLTRKAYLFGVKIPESAYENPDVLNLKKKYSMSVSIGAVIAGVIVILQYILNPNLSLVLGMYYPLIVAAIQFGVYIPCWKQASKLKKENMWTVSEIRVAETKSSVSRGNMSDVPWIWYILCAVVCIVQVVLSIAYYPSLPDRIATHFDINMQPDAWSDKSWGTVLFGPLMNIGTVLLMVLCAISIVKSKLQVSPENPSLSFAQHKMYRAIMGHSLGFLTFTVVLLLFFATLPMIIPDFYVPFWILMALPLVSCIELIFISIKCGQGGCKLKPSISEIYVTASGYVSQPSKNTSAQNDDKYWKIGMFYCNPDDPAVIVEDRFGTNMGFNYSQLAVKICVGIFIVLFVAMYVWLTVLLGNL